MLFQSVSAERSQRGLARTTKLFSEPATPIGGLRLVNRTPRAACNRCAFVASQGTRLILYRVPARFGHQQQLRGIGLVPKSGGSILLNANAAAAPATTNANAESIKVTNFGPAMMSAETTSSAPSNKVCNDGCQAYGKARKQQRPRSEHSCGLAGKPCLTRVQAGQSPGGGGSCDGGDGGGDDSKADGDGYFLNYGTAVRVLREDLPEILARPLQWHIYRRDLCFLTPWVSPVRGLHQYQAMHRVMRALARLLFRSANVEILRVWVPVTGPSGDSSGSTGTASCRRRRHKGSTSGTGVDSSGEGRTRSPDGDNDGDSDDSDERFCGGQLRVRWRATGQPWLPWSEEQRLEVVATYRFDLHGIIASHELTNVIPPEPPLLLWPFLMMAQVLGDIRGIRGSGDHRRLPIPGAGAGYID